MKPMNPVFVLYKEQIYKLYEFSFTTMTIGIPDQFGDVELITVPDNEIVVIGQTTLQQINQQIRNKN